MFYLYYNICTFILIFGFEELIYFFCRAQVTGCSHMWKFKILFEKLFLIIKEAFKFSKNINSTLMIVLGG